MNIKILRLLLLTAALALLIPLSPNPADAVCFHPTLGVVNCPTPPGVVVPDGSLIVPAPIPGFFFFTPPPPGAPGSFSNGSVCCTPFVPPGANGTNGAVVGPGNAGQQAAVTNSVQNALPKPADSSAASFGGRPGTDQSARRQTSRDVYMGALEAIFQSARVPSGGASPPPELESVAEQIKRDVPGAISRLVEKLRETEARPSAVLLPPERVDQVLSQPQVAPVVSPTVVRTLDGPAFKRREATRLREAGREDTSDAAEHEQEAERLRKRAVNAREMAKGASEELEKIYNENADAYDEQAERWEKLAEQERKDAERKSEDARKAQAEAERLERERLEAERRAAEEEARKLKAQRDARQEAERQAAEKAEAEEREIDAQTQKLNEAARREWDAQQRRDAERQQEAGGQPGQSGGQGGDRQEGVGLGDLAKDVAINAGGEALDWKFGKTGAALGELVGGADTILDLWEFGEALDETVEKGLKEEKETRDRFDDLTRSRSFSTPDQIRNRPDPQDIQKKRSADFLERAGNLGAAGTGTVPLGP